MIRGFKPVIQTKWHCIKCHLHFSWEPIFYLGKVFCSQSCAEKWKK